MSSADENQTPSVADSNSQIQPPANQTIAQPSRRLSLSLDVDDIDVFPLDEIPVDSMILIPSEQTAPSPQVATVEQPQIVQLASMSDSRLQLNFSISPNPLDTTPIPDTEVVLDLQSQTPGQHDIYSLLYQSSPLADENQTPSVADSNSQIQPPANQTIAQPSRRLSLSLDVDDVDVFPLDEISVDPFILVPSEQTAPSPQVATVEQPQIVQLASMSDSRLQLNFSISPNPIDTTFVSLIPDTEVVLLDLQSQTPGQYDMYSLLSQSSQLAITYPTSDNPVHVEPTHQEIQDPVPPLAVPVTNDAEEDPPRRRLKTACECPNCHGPEAKRPRFPNGALQHICHIKYCRRTFDRVSNLRRHLDWHRGTRSFFCQTCGKGFARRDKFREHVRHHMTTKRNSRKPVAKIKCDCRNFNDNSECRIIGLIGKPVHLCHVAGCNKSFYHVANLRRHLVAHRVKINFICKYCKKWFRQQDQLNQHLKIHKVGRGNYLRRVNCNCPNCTAPGGNKTKGIDGKPQHVCHISNCRMTFNTVHNLKRHLHLHTGEKAFVCPHCDWKFARKDKYDQHIRRVNQNREQRECDCPNCLSDTKVLDENGRPLHVCHVTDCRKTYDTIVSLREHRKIHNVGPVYFCKMSRCPEMYMSESECDAHMKSAHKHQRQQIECPCTNCKVEGGNQTRNKDGKLIHNCPLPGCDKVFDRPAHVQRHLDSHADTKNFVCPNCSKGFTSKESLENHIVVHMNEPSTSKASDG